MQSFFVAFMIVSDAVDFFSFIFQAEHIAKRH